MLFLPRGQAVSGCLACLSLTAALTAGPRRPLFSLVVAQIPPGKPNLPWAYLSCGGAAAPSDPGSGTGTAVIRYLSGAVAARVLPFSIPTGIGPVDLRPESAQKRFAKKGKFPLTYENNLYKKNID